MIHIEEILDRHSPKEGKVSYTALSEDERKAVYLALKATQVLKLLLEKPLLTRAGALDKIVTKR